MPFLNPSNNEERTSKLPLDRNLQGLTSNPIKCTKPVNYSGQYILPPRAVKVRDQLDINLPTAILLYQKESLQ